LGRTEDELEQDADLHNRLMDDYARSYGHEPSRNWILIVHANNTTEFYRFDDPREMWCCAHQAEIKNALAREVRSLDGVPGSVPSPKLAP